MAISIDIGTRAIKIISGQAKKGGNIVINSNRLIMIPVSILAEGQNQRHNSLFPLIKTALDAMNVRRTDCNFTLSDDRFLIRDLKLPKVADKDLCSIAKQEMISQYSAAEDDIVEIDSITHMPDGSLSLRAAAFSKMLTEGYRKFALDASLNPRSLSFHSSSISKLISTNPDINSYPIGGGNVILADMGMFTCIIHVFSSGKLVFSRHLPVGFSELNSALASMLNPGEDEGAGTLLGASFESSDFKSYPPQIAQRFDAFFIKLSDEISKTLRFLSSSKTASQINTFYLFGGGAQIPGLALKLGKAISIRTEVVQSVSTITAPATLYSDLPFVLNSAGSLL